MKVCKHLSISINRPFAEVYAFVSDPKNIPQWATGLSGSEIKPQGSHWIAESPMGRIRIEFAKTNTLGVVDHSVTVPDGTVFYNPLRVIENDEGSEVVFTLFRSSDMDEAKFIADAKWIEKDLAQLKALLEQTLL